MIKSNQKFVKIGWVFLCIVVLLVSIVKFDHRPDSDISDYLIWSMLVLSAPSGVLVLLLNASLAYVLYNYFSIIIPTTYLTLGVTWLLFFLVGYVQWFYLLPRVADRSPRRMR